MKVFIKKGDMVKVLSGDDKGKTGIVKAVYPKTMSAVVDGINIVTQHKKKKENEEHGTIEKKELPIKLCKLMIICEDGTEAGRIGRKIGENGKMRRYSKRTGNFM